jgi:hypothetical protein
VSDISVERLLARARATRGPHFRLPKCFEGASFENFVTDSAIPTQQGARRQVSLGPAERVPGRNTPDV